MSKHADIPAAALDGTPLTRAYGPGVYKTRKAADRNAAADAAWAASGGCAVEVVAVDGGFVTVMTGGES